MTFSHLFSKLLSCCRGLEWLKSTLFILGVLSSEGYQNCLTGRWCHRPSWIRLHMSRISLGSCLVKNREERVQRSSKRTDLPQRDHCEPGVMPDSLCACSPRHKCIESLESTISLNLGLPLCQGMPSSLVVCCFLSGLVVLWGAMRSCGCARTWGLGPSGWGCSVLLGRVPEC